MAAHLWTNAPPPWEYVELVLCRDVYHCTPLELDRVPATRILPHLTCIDWENRVRKQSGG